VSRRDIYVYGLPVDAAGDAVQTNVAAGPTTEVRFGQAWPLRLAVPITWTVDAFIGDSIGGRSIPTFGALRIANDDGALDDWLARAWDGREINILAPSPGAEVLDEFLVVGMTDQPTGDAAAITLPLRDAGALFDRPVQPHRYLGTGEYEGTVELEGGAKPLVLGRVTTIEPVLLNATKFAYQVHDGAIESAGFSVRERGVAFTTYIAVSDVFTWDATGHGGAVAVDYARGVFRLATAPQGVITCDVRAFRTLYDGLNATHANLARWAMESAAIGVAIDVGAMSALNTAMPDTLCGCYVRESQTLASVLDAIATSCGALWTVSQTGLFSVRVVAWGSSVDTIGPASIVAPPARVTTDPPAWRVTARYARRYRPLTPTDFGASAVTPAQREILGQEWSARVLDAEGPGGGVRTRHPLARDLTIDMMFGDYSGAQPELERRAALMIRDRDRLTVTVWGAYGRYHLGDTVTVRYPRYGLDAGKQFLVLGLDESVALDTDADRTTLRLWGPKAMDE